MTYDPAIHCTVARNSPERAVVVCLYTPLHGDCYRCPRSLRYRPDACRADKEGRPKE